MPAALIPILLLVVSTGIVVGVANVLGQPNRAAKVPSRQKKMEIVAAKVAEAAKPGLESSLARARQVYVESLGPKRFYVGACFDEWKAAMQELCQRDTGKNCGETFDKIFNAIMTAWAADAKAIADWLLSRACLRLKATLRAYRLDGKLMWRVWAMRRGDLTMQNYKGEIGDVVESLVKALEAENPMTLPPKKGYKRAWELVDYPTMTRNSSARVLVWAADEKGKWVIQELVSEPELRRMILVISDSGAFTRQDLEEIDRKRRWAVSTHAQVKNEWPGLAKKA